jgi:HEAT repeat protein
LWEETESVLLEDLLSNEFSTMENAIYAFIGIGQQEIIPALINTLNSKGNRALAKAYLNCGQEELASAARSWAKVNGYPISIISGEAPVEWDSW